MRTIKSKDWYRWSWEEEETEVSWEEKREKEETRRLTFPFRSTT